MSGQRQVEIVDALTHRSCYRKQAVASPKMLPSEVSQFIISSAHECQGQAALRRYRALDTHSALAEKRARDLALGKPHGVNAVAPAR